MKWICGIAMLCCFVVLPVSGNARPTTDFCDSLSSYTTQFIANNPDGTSIKGFAYYLNGKFGYGTTQYAADYWLSRFDSCGVTFPSNVINCGAIESSMDSFYYKLPAYSVSSPSMLWSTYLNDYSYPVLDYSNEVQDWQLAMDWCGISYPAPDTLGSYCDSVRAIDSLFIVSAHLGDVYKLQYNLNKGFSFYGYFDSNIVWHPADLQYWYGQLSACGISCPPAINCARTDSLMGLFTDRATNFASVSPSFLWTSILNNYNASGSDAIYNPTDWKTLLTCCGVSYPLDDTLTTYCDSINAAIAVGDSVFPYMDGNEFSYFMDREMEDWGYYDSTTWVYHNAQYWYTKAAACGAGCPKLVDCAQVDSVLNVFYATYPDNAVHSAGFLWAADLNKYTSARNNRVNSEADWRVILSCCGIGVPATDTMHSFCDSLHAVLKAYRQKYPSGSDLFTYRNFLSIYLGWRHWDAATGSQVNNDDLYWYGKLQQCGDTMPRIVDCNFAANVLQQYYQTHPGDSIHVFPYSWSMALNITGAGTDVNGNVSYYSPTSWESILDGCTVRYPVPDTLGNRCDSIAYVINTMKGYNQKFSSLEWRLDDLFDYQHWDSLSNSYVSNSLGYWFSQISSCNECSLLIPCDTLHSLVDTFEARYPQYSSHCPRQILASYLASKTTLSSNPEFWTDISSCCNVSLPSDTSMTVCDTAFDLTVQMTSLQQLMGGNCFPKWLLSAVFSENDYNWPLETIQAQDSLCGIPFISVCSDTLATHCDSMRSIAYVYGLFFNVTHGEGGDMSPSPEDVYGALYGSSPDGPVLPMIMDCDSNQCIAVDYSWSQIYPLFNSYSCLPKKVFDGVMNYVSGLNYTYEQWGAKFTHCGDTIPVVCDSAYSSCDSIKEAKSIADRLMIVYLINDIEQANTMAFRAYYGRDIDYSDIQQMEAHCSACDSFYAHVTVLGDTVCLGDTAVISASGGSTYSWNTGDDMASIITSIAGTYTVVIGDTNGCTITKNVPAFVDSLPIVNAGNDTTIAVNYTVRLGGNPTASGGIPPYTYVWTAATSVSDSTAANPTTAPTVWTAYTITVTDVKGCTGSDIRNVGTLPLVDILCTGKKWSGNF